MENTNPSKLVPFFQDYGMPLAFGPALAALLGSLYFSEIAGFVPCTLCWYQRILMYPLSVIILVGILSDDRYLPRFILPFSIAGIAVSSYHYLLQAGVFSHSTFCQAGVACNIRYINYLDVITIPFLALTAFVLITLLTSAYAWANGQAAQQDERIHKS